MLELKTLCDALITSTNFNSSVCLAFRVQPKDEALCFIKEVCKYYNWPVKNRSDELQITCIGAEATEVGALIGEVLNNRFQVTVRHAFPTAKQEEVQ